jgi:predicted DNA-binding ribbon-helix-helix protein
MKSSIVKRSIVLAGHKTSVSLEEPFYQGLAAISFTNSRMADVLSHYQVPATKSDSVTRR